MNEPRDLDDKKGGQPGGTASSSAFSRSGTGTRVGEGAPEIRESLKSLGATATNLTEGAKGEAGKYVESRVEQGASGVKAAADAVEEAARSVREKHPDGMAASLSDYAIDAAHRVSEFAESLRGRSVDELAGDVRSMARNNPAVFLAGSVAVGFALARFLRASGAVRPSDGSGSYAGASGNLATWGRREGEQSDRSYGQQRSSATARDNRSSVPAQSTYGQRAGGAAGASAGLGGDSRSPAYTGSSSTPGTGSAQSPDRTTSPPGASLGNSSSGATGVNPSSGASVGKPGEAGGLA